MRLKTIEWQSETSRGLIPGHVRMIDQTLLPEELVYIEIRDITEIRTAIKTLQVRGAPAIGIAAAMGVAAAVQDVEAETGEDVVEAVEAAAAKVADARPTAVNLFWALDRMKRLAHEQSGLAPVELKERLVREAVNIRDEDAAMCRSIGEHGLSLLKPNQAVLTHCNAGGLAAAELGTALAPIYLAREAGMNIRVFADETRPLLQGSRLTAWELRRAGIDVTVICDNVAAQVMREGRVDLVMVGSDRIAANGDAANKIGTYGLATLARAHEIPFYILAPTSSIDITLAAGNEIPIEQRAPEEVIHGFGRRTAPADISVYSPAFDVTPAGLITAIVSEKGVALPPFSDKLKEWVEGS